MRNPYLYLAIKFSCQITLFFSLDLDQLTMYELIIESLPLSIKSDPNRHSPSCGQGMKTFSLLPVRQVMVQQTV